MGCHLFQRAKEIQEGEVVMKNHTEKEFRGNLRGIGLSLLALIAIAIPRLISKDFDIVFYMTSGLFVIGVLVFVYYLAKYYKLKDN